MIRDSSLYQSVSAIVLALLVTQGAHAQSIQSASAKSPQAGTIFVYPERIPLKDGGMFTARRGQMFVPVNRSKPDSDVIAIEFYQFPCRNPNTSISPIFMLEGGPGFEGLESALEQPGRFEAQFGKFVGAADVVVVGQRGIGSSKPWTVVDLKQAARPADRSVDQEAAKKDFQSQLSREKKYWEDQGLDLSGFTVLEAAADVHDVCKALGYQKMIAVGGSFGSHWAMAIMRQHPDLIERALLSGLEGPDHTWDHPGWLWNVYKRVAEEAEADPKLVDLIPEGGLISAMEAMVNRATEKPFTVTLHEGDSGESNVLIDGHAMRMLSRGYSGNINSWPSDVITMHAGNFDAAAKYLLSKARTKGRINSTASFWLLDTASGISSKRRAEFDADPALKIIDDPNERYAAAAPIWDIDLGDEFRLNFQADVPTVLLHGTWDLNTPYENAQELLPAFTNGKLITVKRGSHGALFEALGSNRQFAIGMFNFIVSGEMKGLPEEIELQPAGWTIPKTNGKDSK